jgi:hypothetical protein
VVRMAARRVSAMFWTFAGPLGRNFSALRGLGEEQCLEVHGSRLLEDICYVS